MKKNKQNLLTDIVYGLVDPRVYISLYGQKKDRKKKNQVAASGAGGAAA